VALHERVAYAVEYGALLVPHGKVAIRREIAHVGGGERRVWRRNEHGGSPIGPPDRQGFSLSMIERSLWRELQGAVTFEFAQAGLRGTLVIRLDPAIASRANARKGRS
jgi:two-component sensor histidine kinase